MPQLPTGYAPSGAPFRRPPQPPAIAPLPLPPQGTGPRVIGAPATKANSDPQQPLFVKPIIQIWHSIFGG